MATGGVAFGRLQADILLREAAERHGIRLELLVAETGLWAHPEVHRRLCYRGSPAFFPDRRRLRAGQGEKKGQRIGDLSLDDNTYANNAIKLAVGVSRENLIGFEACHIWPRTCYDERYHSAIANLVLLPRALGNMTDHCEDIRRALQYRAFELYAWHPEDQPEPEKPREYPTIWRNPMPFTADVERALARRMLGRPTVEQSKKPEVYSPIQASQSMLTTSRDYARFALNVDGRVTAYLPKRIAMLELAKRLVSCGISPEQINAASPGMGNRMFISIEGEFAATRFEEILGHRRRNGGRQFDPLRYFCDDPELIHFGGKTYALTNQWGSWTESVIAALLMEFPNFGISVQKGCQTRS